MELPADGDGHANQAAGIEVLEAVERGLEVGAESGLFASRQRLADSRNSIAARKPCI